MKEEEIECDVQKNRLLHLPTTLTLCPPPKSVQHVLFVYPPSAHVQAVRYVQQTSFEMLDMAHRQ